MTSIQESYARLLNGDTNTSTAHAEARLFGNAMKLLALELEHARLTGRLKDGSDAMPGFRAEADK